MESTSTQALTSSVPLTIPTITVPKISLSSFTGTISEVSSQMIEAASTLVETIVAPIQAVYSAVDSTYKTYDSTINTLSASLAATRLISPGTVTKIQKEIERASTYRDTTEMIKNRLDSTMKKIDKYIEYGKQVANDSVKHSAQWIEEKINWVLEKIAYYVQMAINWATERLNKLIESARTRVEKEAEKLQAKLEARANVKAEQIAERQKKQKTNKVRNAQALLNA